MWFAEEFLPRFGDDSTANWFGGRACGEEDLFEKE